MKVSLIKCQSYDSNEVSQSVTRAVELIGGINNFIKPGEKILVKPNLLSARLPERAVTTHPEVVRAILRLVRNAGAIPLLGDSPGGAVKGVERVWTETGMKKLADEENVQLVNFETSGAVSRNINHPTISKIHLASITLDVDGIINLPKLKTHGLMIYTGAIKNLFGCVPGMRKAEYHKMAPHPDDFSHLLDEIYLVYKEKIRFTLIDGIMGMEGNGPSSGDKRKLAMIVASKDAVILDLAVTQLLGLKPAHIESINYLANKQNLEKIEWAGNSHSDFNLKDFKFPSNWYLKLIPKWLINIIGSYLWLKPFINSEVCTNCQMCVDSCPIKAIKNVPGAKPVVITDECIACLCCHELCTFKAIELKKSLLAKILIRH
ncbi:MAG: DUF362 domain-containing protein [Elusimicrobia bacterium]|nr:DUF362 domain-containing protein [Candidatus Liberimonas magnetica]